MTNADPIEVKPKILVVYPFLHHYRYGVFSEMDSSQEFTYVFAASAVGTGGIQTIPFDKLSTVIPLKNVWWRSFLYQRGLMRRALLSDIDGAIFLADPRYVSTWIATLIFRARHKPVLFWTIGFHRPEEGIKAIVRRAYFALANRLLFYGEEARKIAIDLGYNGSKIDVVHNSHSSLASSVARDPISIPKLSGLTIGAVVRLSAYKNLPLVIKAAQILRSAGTDVNVLFVGEGPERKALEELAASLGVPIYLPGAAYHPEVLASVYEELDITVLPTNAGLSVMQSFAHGTPAIGGDDVYQQAPEWEAIRPGINGEHFETGNEEGLARAIGRVNELLKSRPLQVSGECRQTVVNEWSPQYQAAAIEASLRRALNEHPRAY